MIQPPQIVLTNKKKNLELFGVGGLALGTAIALIVTTILARWKTRGRTTPEQPVQRIVNPPKIEMLPPERHLERSAMATTRVARMSVRQRRVKSRGGTWG